jgi:SAM-dependent methyltransferase
VKAKTETVQSKFVPGAVDYDGAMARDFNAGRALSADSQRVWHTAFAPYLADVDRILDVGAGTGRFAALMAEWFGATVIGVEPARGMRDAALGSGRHPQVAYVGGRAEHLPLCGDSVSAAVLSNVYHHLADREASARELHRVLRVNGRVLIRGAFGDRLGEITLFDHFPEAKAICEQFPSLEETIGTFQRAGFDPEAVHQVVQRTCESLKELAARTRLRADTTLVLMSDETFAVRQAALEIAAALETEATPVVDTLDLLVVRKVATAQPCSGVGTPSAVERVTSRIKIKQSATKSTW